MKTFALVVTLLCAVAAFGQDVAGHYYLQGVMEVGSELMLKPDGNFEYMLAYGAADYWSKGTWHRDGNKVILQSSGKEEEPFRMLRSEAGEPGRIGVHVLGKNGKGVPNIHVGIDAGGQKLDAQTDSDGIAMFPDNPKAKAVYFEVRVYSLEAGPFAIDPSHSKDFYFEINGDAIQQVLFKNEALTIEGKELIMKHGDDKPMRYVKE